LSIKAIVFDYGQVISLPPDPKVMDRIAGLMGVKREKLEPILWSVRGEYDRGTINAKEYYKKVISHLDVSLDDKTIDEIIEMDLKSWRNINAGTVTLMEDIKKAGYTLAILSNMPHDFLAWARKSIPVFSLVHAGLFSCEVNLIKPEEAIYHKLLSMLNVKAAETVFFDDIAENIKSARVLGIEAFLWADPDRARADLLSLGIRL